MKSVGIFIVLSLLTSCALLPTSETQLVKKNRVQETCSDQPTEIVISKLSPKIYSCYGDGAYTSISTGTGTYQRFLPYRVEEREEASSKIYNIINENKYYGFRLQIEPGVHANCATKITSHTMNFMWDRQITHVLKWLDDPDVGCIKH